jgi:hypothetical protein
MFKKVKFDLARDNVISTMNGENVSLSEAIRILKDPNVINFSANKMTRKEYFESISKK